jgi:hypothetical protein
MEQENTSTSRAEVVALERAYREEYEIRLADYLHKALHYTSSPLAVEEEEEEEESGEEIEQDENQNECEEKETDANLGEESTSSPLDQVNEDQKVSSEPSTEQPKNKNSRPQRIKHLFLTRAQEIGEIHPEDSSYYTSLCSLVLENTEKADFAIIILIRLMYLLAHNEIRVNHIINTFLSFSFWPTSNHVNHQMPNVIFWSENHTFMYLSTAYLLRQKLENSPKLGKLPRTVTEKDERHLRAYLEGHTKFNGVYEVLSSTYLPYTLCSLLNLYDFADDQMVRYQAEQLINRIVCSFTLVTNRSGICNLSASSRQYPKTRLKNHGHNVNQLIAFITGASVDEFLPSSIVDFLLTTTWRPPLQAIQNFFLPQSYPPPQRQHQQSSEGAAEERDANGGFSREREKMNHKTSEIRDIYKVIILGKIPATPFYWSFAPPLPSLLYLIVSGRQVL